jgi:hypothetical protein
VSLAVLAATVQIILTLPSTSALVQDSTVYECIGGPVTHDISKVNVWMWPATGGLPSKVMIQDVKGREGKQDTLTLSPPAGGAHYYVTVSDTAGNASCPSNVVYFGPTTDVAIEKADPVVRTDTFDVTGRRVKNPKATGIYYKRDTRKSGETKVTKVVIIR